MLARYAGPETSEELAPKLVIIDDQGDLFPGATAGRVGSPTLSSFVTLPVTLRQTRIMRAIEGASVNTGDGDGWMCIADGRIADFGRQASNEPRSVRPSPTQDRQLDAGEHLFFEGDARTHVFVVQSGWVKLYRTLIDGQRQVVGFANVGSILGLESDADHSNDCQAVTDVTVRSMPIGKITEICASDGALAQQLLGQLGRQLGAAQAQLATIGAQSAQQKLASFLISMSDLCDACNGEAFRLPMRRGEMGEFLGLRLETVSRQMGEFQRRGWIRMSSLYSCRIVQRDVLEALALGGEADDGPMRLAS